MRRMILALLAATPVAAIAQNQAPAPPPSATQVAAAVLPLPEAMRAAAAVLGYAPDLRLVTLRAGTNHMTCLADDPRDDRFHVACYHDTMEPFMARGRELRAQGLRPEVVDSTRYAEAASGAIRMPPVASLYSLAGPAGSYDAATNTVRGGRPLFVVYIPYATEASTGLSAMPREDAPWIMFPGSPRAHIMFVPTM